MGVMENLWRGLSRMGNVILAFLKAHPDSHVKRVSEGRKTQAIRYSRGLTVTRHTYISEGLLFSLLQL